MSYDGTKREQNGNKKENGYKWLKIRHLIVPDRRFFAEATAIFGMLDGRKVDFLAPSAILDGRMVDCDFTLKVNKC